MITTAHNNVHTIMVWSPVSTGLLPSNQATATQPNPFSSWISLCSCHCSWQPHGKYISYYLISTEHQHQHLVQEEFIAATVILGCMKKHASSIFSWPKKIHYILYYYYYYYYYIFVIIILPATKTILNPHFVR